MALSVIAIDAKIKVLSKKEGEITVIKISLTTKYTELAIVKCLFNLAHPNQCTFLYVYDFDLCFQIIILHQILTNKKFPY